MKKHTRGFTLIEMAVVLVILSMAAAGGLAVVTRSTDVEKMRLTRERMDKILRATELYAQKWYAVTCPASPTQLPTDAGFSRSMGYVGAGPAPTCITATGLARSASNNVFMGAVPTGTLGLPPEYMLDGWGRKFAFVVDQDMINGQGTFLIDKEFFRGNNSDILLVDASGNAVVKDATNSPSGAPSAGDARNPVVVLISHGKNGFGAYPYKGTAQVVDSRVTANRTMENDNAHVSADSVAFDTVFRALTYKETDTGSAATAQMFDDIVMWRTQTDLKNATNK